jgi:acetyl esterase/lipase
MGLAGIETTVNVVTPTLTVYLPAAASATGTGVIIAPGGGFIGLSIKSEGHDVAKWLVARRSRLCGHRPQIPHEANLREGCR